ncbi:hypothetical protein F0562_035499 [Nyssa sinensis]|uniref:Uncharacterized protein n=1 Tax=Nyssa sinensis TaxID=561372 RepID=A0A5J5ACF7_9ASTE|nr:hypothetical protein F0562_035499 [Nyssa sinensis]
MASAKLHKPTDEARNGNQESSFGHKIAEMATWAFRTITESWHKEQQSTCHGSACEQRPVAKTQMKKKEKKDEHAVIAAPKNAEHKKKEKNLKKKKKAKNDTSSDRSSSSESEDDVSDKRKK